ncbi:MAG: type II 3-dehydroquinate dehydratase [Alphaproteobacteria bacterium]|nr:type II 3-dehydroquinate dehydratase [Alphaproteobacteria bacterium]
MKTILIINGPNLNMLGLREPEIYGTLTLSEIEGQCRQSAQELGFTIDVRQSNHEGVLIDWVQEAVLGNYAGLIINAGAYTHTSIALHDALKILRIPIVEVHLSDPKQRESFRHHSYTEPLAKAVFKGEGLSGYIKALHFLAQKPL